VTAEECVNMIMTLCSGHASGPVPASSRYVTTWVNTNWNWNWGFSDRILLSYFITP